MREPLNAHQWLPSRERTSFTDWFGTGGCPKGWGKGLVLSGGTSVRWWRRMQRCRLYLQLRSDQNQAVVTPMPTMENLPYKSGGKSLLHGNSESNIPILWCSKCRPMLFHHCYCLRVEFVTNCWLLTLWKGHCLQLFFEFGGLQPQWWLCLQLTRPPWHGSWVAVQPWDPGLKFPRWPAENPAVGCA